MHTRSRNSSVTGSTPPASTRETARAAPARSSKYAMPVPLSSGAGISRSVSSVITASVPSLPHSRRRRS